MVSKNQAVEVEWEYQYSSIDYDMEETRTTGRKFSTLEEALAFINERLFSRSDMQNVRIFKLDKLNLEVVAK